MSQGQKISAAVLITAVIHALIGFVTTTCPVFVGRMGPTTLISDVFRYYTFALMPSKGMVPYWDFVVEYPVLAMAVVAIPGLFTLDFPRYRVVFGLEMLVFDAWIVFLVARHLARREGVGRVVIGLVWYTAIFATLCPLLFARYDVVPTAFGFAAAHFWFSGKGRLGGVLAGLGVLLKVFPGAVAAPALLWEASRAGRARYRGASYLALTLAAGAAGWCYLGGSNVRYPFSYHKNRGLEIESLYAGALLLLGKATGNDPGWVYDFGAFHLTSPLSRRVAGVAPAVQAASLLVVVWRFWRSGMRDGVRCAGAAVLAVAVTGKVLSPQYMIWFLPFAVVLGGRLGVLVRCLYLACCALTLSIYPLGYFDDILRHHTPAIALLNCRNLMLLGTLAAVVFGPAGAAPPPPQTTAAPGG